ncbi:hypothetical protein GGX14DRAFT_589360, partial [Mycena pura]
MVSVLWKACSQGDLDAVHTALAAEHVDIEVKDHTGSTPLIEAIKNGHADVVRVLLDKGADPTNASSQGLPETYTSDQNILGMLNFARSKLARDSSSSQENGYDTSAYAPPTNYPYYANINGAPPPDVYYPPQMPLENNRSHRNNLPPPEVASAIPCRYFPACRYGSECMFQHPQGPYFQGPLPPPAPYPTSYDQMPPQSYAPYYPVSPPSFPPMNRQAPMPPQQGQPIPPPPSSEMMPPPPPQAHFSPNGAPAMPYGPISPLMYSHPGQAPLPMTIPPLPPLHQGSAPAQQPPRDAFNPSPPSAPQSGFVLQQNPVTAPYPHVNGNGSAGYPDANDAIKSPQLNPQPDAVAPRQDVTNRRGNGRRGSFASRKQAPPCIFFPMGRCKNGDDCRFPHIIPQEGATGHTSFYPSRGGGPRPRGHANGNGSATVDERMSNLSIQPVRGAHLYSTSLEINLSLQHGHSGPASRGRGGKPNMNGQAHKKAAFVKQRVPNADEFPVLGGTITPTRSSGVNGLPNGHGPTAAQVLLAPRPVRSNSSQALTPRAVSPEHIMQEAKPEVNGTTEAPSLPVSFASIATPGAD